jgi:hypothetical protein
MHGVKILMNEGFDGYVRFVGEHNTQRVHFNYRRGARGPGEQGSLFNRIFSNLITFKKGVWWFMTNSLGKIGAALRSNPDKKINDLAQASQSSVSLIQAAIIGHVIGELFRRVTNAKRNPYNLSAIMLDPTIGALPIAAQEKIGKTVNDIMIAIADPEKKKRDQATSRSIVDITEMADNFVPYYKIAFDAVEGATDRTEIDRHALREIREAISKRVGGRYRNKRARGKRRTGRGLVTKTLFGYEDVEGREDLEDFFSYE